MGYHFQMWMRGYWLVVSIFSCDQTGWKPSSPVTETSPSARLIALYDSNEDGRLSLAEYQRHASDIEEFRRFDEDGDEQLTEAEMRALLWGHKRTNRAAPPEDEGNEGAGTDEAPVDG